jgi:hypothetical protein
MRIFLSSLLFGIISAVVGALAGLLISALLVELNCLADPGGITIIFLLVVSLAFAVGVYGFLHAKFKLEKRPPNQIRKVRYILALACLAAGGGFLLLNALAITATLNPHGHNSPYTISLIGKLLSVGFLFFGASYGILVYGRKTRTL